LFLYFVGVFDIISPTPRLEVPFEQDTAFDAGITHTTAPTPSRPRKTKVAELPTVANGKLIFRAFKVAQA
jgi:hypothetical protein